MSHLRLIILSVASLFLASCEKLEMPSLNQDKQSSQTQQSQPKDSTSNTSDDDSAPYSPDATADYCVWDLTDGEVYDYFDQSDLPKETNAINRKSVTGYIVGYCSASTLSANSAHFSTAGAKEWNILLADNANETRYTKCAPVQLANGNKMEKHMRSNLNLATNPSNIGRRVIIWGNIKKYLRATGIQDVYGYQFVNELTINYAPKRQRTEEHK